MSNRTLLTYIGVVIIASILKLLTKFARRTLKGNTPPHTHTPPPPPLYYCGFQNEAFEELLDQYCVTNGMQGRYDLIRAVLHETRKDPE